MGSFVTHLEGSLDGSRHDHRIPQGTHAGRPLLVRYDLEAVARALTPAELERRPATLWRWRELLPVEDDAHVVSLGEVETPLIRCPRLGAELGLADLWIKDESGLPTGSFKARGLALAVSRAKELGLKRVAIPTAGNAGGALAAYAARAGLEAFVFMPADTPLVNRAEAALFGARCFLVDGLITDCAALVQAGAARMGWFDLSTLKEPYRLEGKKTMGLELARQLGWSLPDAILYPTGGGTGLIGMSKAFDELAQLGWLARDARPRFFACQSDGCAPIVLAFERGERFAETFPGAATLASGLRVPRAVGDFLILDALRRSGGAAVAAREAEILPWMRRASRLEGVGLCPESAACLAVVPRLLREGRLRRDERVVLFNTGAAQKYVECLPQQLPRLARGAEPDWEALVAQP
ncbi:MAG TPA: threonine synthase [Planctomycetota bacterium]